MVILIIVRLKTPIGHIICLDSYPKLPFSRPSESPVKRVILSTVNYGVFHVDRTTEKLNTVITSLVRGNILYHCTGPDTFKSKTIGFCLQALLLAGIFYPYISQRTGIIVRIRATIYHTDPHFGCS